LRIAGAARKAFSAAAYENIRSDQREIEQIDSKGEFRCRGCGRKGRAIVSIKWWGEGA